MFGSVETGALGASRGCFIRIRTRTVYRFDADEVDRLAEGMLDGSVSLWAELQGDDPDEEGNSGLLARRCAAAEAKVARLHRENRVWRDVLDRLCAVPGMKQRVVEIARAIAAKG